MISMLIGTIAGQERDIPSVNGRVVRGAVVVACAGVGYSVKMGARDQKHVAHNKSVVVLTRQIFEEGGRSQLFGWFNERDRALFDRLVKVHGVGPVIAGNVVDVYDVDDLCVATAADIARRCEGVGKVIAGRITDSFVVAS